MPTTAKFGREKCADAGSRPLDAGHRGPTMSSRSDDKKTDERRIVTDGGRDTPDRDDRVRTVPTNRTDQLNLTNGSGFDMTDAPEIDSPRVGVFLNEPITTQEGRRIFTRQQVTPDDTDEHPTVTACMDCLEWFPNARESWERCPMCGSDLVDVESAGDGR